MIIIANGLSQADLFYIKSSPLATVMLRFMLNAPHKSFQIVFLTVFGIPVSENGPILNYSEKCQSCQSLTQFLGLKDKKVD